jgi:hypothetical protein
MSSEISHTNWIGRTGQKWKLCVFYFLIEAVFVGVIIFTAQYNGFLTSWERYIDKASLALTCLVIGIVATAWLAKAFRCPRCKTNIGKYVISKINVSTWLDTFLSLQECPNCGEGKYGGDGK